MYKELRLVFLYVYIAGTHSYAWKSWLVESYDLEFYFPFLRPCSHEFNGCMAKFEAPSMYAKRASVRIGET